MAKLGRRPVLDAVKKREILAIVAVGCSRRTAAAYVGCSPSTIANEMQRDADFAGEIERRESSAEVGYVRNIQDAAKDARHWRAAAWLLERRWPDDFGKKKQGTVSVAQLESLLSGLAKIIVEEVPVAVFRKGIIRRLQRMVGNFFRDMAKHSNATIKDAVASDAVVASGTEGETDTGNANKGNTDTGDADAVNVNDSGAYAGNVDVGRRKPGNANASDTPGGDAHK